MRFKTRKQAGIVLAETIKKYFQNLENTVIVSVPRGGVPVAYQVAKLLKIPFSLVITKKLTTKFNPEFALGAIAADGTLLLNEQVFNYLKITQNQLEEIEKQALFEVHRRVEKYMDGKIPNIKDKIVIIIDDGIATGYTTMVAGKYLRNLGAKKVILAVPVCPVQTIFKAKEIFDDVICLYQIRTENFAVGAFYEDFHQLSDEEMLEYLKNARIENLLT